MSLHVVRVPAIEIWVKSGDPVEALDAPDVIFAAQASVQCKALHTV